MIKEKAKRNFKAKWLMPSAFAILFAIAGIMAALTWVVPSGQYDVATDADGNTTPIAGTYKEVKKVTEVDGSTVDVRQGIYQTLSSPVKGTIDAIDVVLFVLILGGFLGVTMKTGALDAMFGNIIKKLKGREKWIIPILMIFFAVGGTTYGMQEETVAFYALVVPLMLAAGFNGVTAAMTIILGAGVGVLGSTINPFSTGIASGFANISLADGLVERLIILGLTLAAAIWFTMRYAAKVREGKFDSDAKNDSSLLKLSKTNGAKTLEFTARRKVIASIFGLTFLVMILSVIPWSYKFGINVFADFNDWLMGIPFVGAAIGNILPLGDWWFNDLSVLFFISSLLIGLIYFRRGNADNTSKEGFFDVFVGGARDLLAVALIIGFARGISVVMSDGMIMDTIIHYGELALTGVASWLLPALAFIVYLPLSVFIPSTSGLATASMPILAPLADFSGIERHLMVTAFATAEGVVNMIAPTVASVMGGLALAKVSYGLWLKRTWKFMIIVSVISVAVITISALL